MRSWSRLALTGQNTASTHSRFTDYCKEAIEHDLSCDYPDLRKNLARIIGWSMFCTQDNVEGPRQKLETFTPVFKVANESSPRQFYVLIQVLLMMVSEVRRCLATFLDEERYETLTLQIEELTSDYDALTEADMKRAIRQKFDELCSSDAAFYNSHFLKEALQKAECKLGSVYSLLTLP